MLALTFAAVALTMAALVVWQAFPRASQHAEAIEQIYEQAQLAGVDTSHADPAADKALLELLPKLCSDEGRGRDLLEGINFRDLKWLSYRELVMSTQDAMVGCVRAEVTEDEAHEFYRLNLGNFERQDILTLDLEVWSDGAVTESVEWVVTEENVRMLQEQHDDVLSQGLSLMQGEETLVTRNDGSSVLIHCRNRIEMGQYSFEEVQGAAAQQLAQQRVDELIAEGAQSQD